jgi:hypothetical protein
MHLSLPHAFFTNCPPHMLRFIILIIPIWRRVQFICRTFHLKRKKALLHVIPSRTRRRNQWQYWIPADGKGTTVISRIRIVKCFTTSSKRFRCEVMFENEHAPCSWINHVCSWTAFAQIAGVGKLRELRSSNQGDLDSSVMGIVKKGYYTGLGLLLFPFL